MANRSTVVPLLNSARHPIPHSTYMGLPDPQEKVDVTVVVKRRAPIPSPSVSDRMSHSAFSDAHGVDPSALSAVLKFNQASGLNLIEVDRRRRIVRLQGSIARMSRAFGVTLERFKSRHGVFRARTGPVHVPQTVAGAIEAVFGLDNRPAAWPRFRMKSEEALGARGGLNFHVFTGAQVTRLYGFSPNLSAAGQRIAIIELGGGFSGDDVTQFFARFGLELPRISVISVGGGKNQIGIDRKADGEVALDIQVAGAAAPGASIIIYFAADASEQSYLNAFGAAVHDPINRPTVISLSWGGPETYSTNAFLLQFDQIAQDAAHQGITLCAASGDEGSYDLPPEERDGHLNLVDFPAASPFVLACGGTRLIYRDGQYREVVWNDFDLKIGGASGGGISSFFNRPNYQKGTGMRALARGAMRGVPDVAGDADPLTGFLVRFGGSYKAGGGTSAVAPLWAALIARVNAELGRQVGFINPLLYHPLVRATFHDVTSGNNGGFSARRGWDECTGLGTPRGGRLIAALRSTIESGLVKAPNLPH
jgi:kumamolisin